jgi:hypothetical protein
LRSSVRRSRTPIRYDGIEYRAFASMSLDELLDRYHRAADAVSRGDPDPVKELCSGGCDFYRNADHPG